MCVQQTTLDLLNIGFEVHIVADGVSSRSQVDRMLAIEVGVGGWTHTCTQAHKHMYTSTHACACTMQVHIQCLNHLSILTNH